MNQISNLSIIPLLLLALGLVIPIARLLGIEAKPHRYSSIDGLRGFLALLVFIHHSNMWFYFWHLHRWAIVSSGLFMHFGSTSVALFFMITAFLFFSKLINSPSVKVDWPRLYISRVMRIMPLYLVAVASLFVIVAILSRFEIHESIGNLAIHMMQWLFFMEPDINGLQRTNLLLTGVQWSLAYEWLFYCSLAIFGMLLFRIKTSTTVVFFACIGMVIFVLVISAFYSINVWFRLSHFLGGIAAAFLVRNQRVRRIAANFWTTFLLMGLLYIALFRYPDIFSWIPYLCIVAVFVGIACGNTLFGILSLKPTRLLGQISYSVYLLHGLLLFVTMRFIIGPSTAGKLSPLEWWLLIGGCCIGLVILTSLTYYFIERPCLGYADKIMPNSASSSASGRRSNTATAP